MKNIRILLLLIIIGKSSISQIPTKEFIDSLIDGKTLCGEYFNPEQYVDINFSVTDTLECYRFYGDFILEKVKIIRTFSENGNVLVEAFYSNGSRYDTESYYKGKRHGTCTEWYENGNMESLYYYENGYKLLTLHWYENGTLKKITEREQDNPKYKNTRFDILGFINKVTYKIDSVPNSFYEIYYYPQTLKKKAELIEGNGRQPYVVYYENGNIQMKGDIYHVLFARVGKWQEWYEDGTLKREYYFNDDIPEKSEGTWKWWNKKGKLIRKEKYNNGELIE